jgi:hypothetical protein
MTAKQRQAHDRLTLLTAVVQQAGENAARVLDVLREEDRRREARSALMLGTVAAIVGGAGLSAMLALTSDGGRLAVGLIEDFLCHVL